MKYLLQPLLQAEWIHDPRQRMQTLIVAYLFLFFGIQHNATQTKTQPIEKHKSNPIQSKSMVPELSFASPSPSMRGASMWVHLFPFSFSLTSGAFVRLPTPSSAFPSTQIGLVVLISSLVQNAIKQPPSFSFRKTRLLSYTYARLCCEQKYQRSRSESPLSLSPSPSLSLPLSISFSLSLFLSYALTRFLFRFSSSTFFFFPPHFSHNFNPSILPSYLPSSITCSWGDTSFFCTYNFAVQPELLYFFLLSVVPFAVSFVVPFGLLHFIRHPSPPL